MNEQIKAGSDIHAGDGGYSIGTKEKYDEFVKIRNKSLAKSRIRELAVEAGASINTGTHPLTGVVDGLTMRNKEIEKFAELIVRECLDIALEVRGEPATDTHYVIGYDRACEKMISGIREHFGVEE